MDTMNYILFICTATPMLLMLIPIEKGSRKVIFFMLIGMFCCLFISEVNGFFLNISDFDLLYFTINITPVTEEIIKTLPVLLFALICSDSRKDIITASFSVGVGFAMLENLMILTQNFQSVDLWFALIRGFCSGLMHSICTIAIGFFIVFIKKRHKIFVAGSITALNLAIVYHSVYNLLVQASSRIARISGLGLPLITYTIVNLTLIVRIRQTVNKPHNRQKQLLKDQIDRGK